MLKRVFKKYGRAYLDESTGVEYPGVTTILDIMQKGGLGPWQMGVALDHMKSLVNSAFKGERLLDWEDIKKNAMKAPNNYRDEKGSQGTHIHNVIENHMLKKDIRHELRDDPKLSAILLQVDKWVKDNSLKPVLVEAYLVSKKHIYAGAVDLVARQNTNEHGEQLILVDFKTGKGIYDTHKWQLAAYAVAYNEMYGECPDISFLQHISYDNQMMVEASHMHKSEVQTEFTHFMNIYGAFRARWGKYLQQEV